MSQEIKRKRLNFLSFHKKEIVFLEFPENPKIQNMDLVAA
jgi:cystathionine beta-lyase/cystathionine gamma-synthase